ncbi:hypothetical protein C0Q70_19499 [Pomacea canaliculata]|uniref:Uncharacterized protein n=1 Tax=Pomacea canaliculata TaxID=400727 RepID=A0A2T7NJJ9_POMCA|nr:hypothetical protein C0Q70_19499 [Pomacea canaliculata]
MDVQVAFTSCTDPATLNLTVTENGVSEHDRLLQCLNDEKAGLYIPVIVFLVVLIITGTFGNVLVCCVYLRKSYKASSTISSCPWPYWTSSAAL